MSRRRDVATGDLFTSIPQPVAANPGALDFRSQVASLIAEMLDVARANDPSLDRYQVAASVSRLVGREVSKAMLDGYTSESREAFNLPFWMLPAMEHVCGTTLLTEWLAITRGGRLVLGPAALDSEIGRMQNQMEADKERLKTLRELRRRGW